MLLRRMLGNLAVVQADQVDGGQEGGEQQSRPGFDPVR